MKKVGLAAFDNNTKSAFNTLSTNILQQQVDELNTQLAVFQNALTYFAVEHGEEIRSNPQFRAEFAKMCTAIGVDPLASSSSNKKGSLWANILGKDVNDFYFELAVLVIEICRISRDENGGIISVSEVKARLSNSTTKINAINYSEDDIERAVKSLKILGSGFDLFQAGRKMMIRSVPEELSNDQAAIIEACQALGYVNVTMLRDNFGWQKIRSTTALGDMVSAGIMWVDYQGGPETNYWLPSWMDRE